MFLLTFKFKFTLNSFPLYNLTKKYDTIKM